MFFKSVVILAVVSLFAAPTPKKRDMHIERTAPIATVVAR